MDQTSGDSQATPKPILALAAAPLALSAIARSAMLKSCETAVPARPALRCAAGPGSGAQVRAGRPGQAPGRASAAGRHPADVRRAAPRARAGHGHQEAGHKIGSVAVAGVIFDWGGTLTPWHSVDHVELWNGVCAPHFPAERAAALAAAIQLAERELWLTAEREHRSATMDQVFELAGVTPTEALLASYTAAWEPHTFTDPEAGDLLRYLRDQGIKVGVLSNTMWPRSLARGSIPAGRPARPDRRRCLLERDQLDKTARRGVPGRHERDRRHRSVGVRLRR